MKDFTLKAYNQLIKALLRKQSNFTSFSNYLISNPENSIILRHDVDRIPDNALQIAKLESDYGINGTYYFRMVEESYDEKIIQAISKLNHEIGYHYEDIDLVYKTNPGKYNNKNIETLLDDSYIHHIKNLTKLREIADVKTICMHGSPRQKFSNTLLWEKYNYKLNDILGEPYYDIDFNKFAYFTDTGRRWNGNKISIRDNVDSKFTFNYKTTKQVIANIKKLPKNLMFTIHPERWSDDVMQWTKQLVLQNLKNPIKKILIQVRK